MQVNTRQYWESRFSSSDWTKRGGNIQSIQHARRYVGAINLDRNFEGTICDFGCAEGDALPIYVSRFPRAKFIGVDFSKAAIVKARKKYGGLATFIVGDQSSVPKVDVIVCSHTLEHLENDVETIRTLLNRASDVYVIVPYRENPLSREHLRLYDEESFDDLKPMSTTVQSAGWAFIGIQWFFHVVLKNMIRPLIGRPIIREPQQIVFHFSRAQ